MIINRTQNSVTGANKGAKLELLSERLLTTGTSSTFGSNTSRVYIEMVGGGGGGGGAVGNNGQVAAGGGGGAGAFTTRILDVTPGGSFTYVIGTAGTGGANTGTNGTAGGATSMTVDALTITAPGGQGGTGSGSGTGVLAVLGGVGGVSGVNGDVNAPGQPGGNTVRFNGTVKTTGNGGSSPFGRGGSTAIASAVGQAGTGNGSGGGGGTTNNNTDRVGGNGTVGAIYIVEYGYV